MTDYAPLSTSPAVHDHAPDPVEPEAPAVPARRRIVVAACAAGAAGGVLASVLSRLIG